MEKREGDRATLGISPNHHHISRIAQIILTKTQQESREGAHPCINFQPGPFAKAAAYAYDPVSFTNTKTLKPRTRIMVNKSHWAFLFVFFFLLKPAIGATPYEDDFRLLTFNVFFLPQILAPYGQQTRAELIANTEFVQGQDLIILNELFEAGPSAALLNSLKGEYPFQTPILAAPFTEWDASLGAFRPLAPGNGGVSIVSRWPIVEKVQYIYAEGCGSDGFSKKGFVYVKIDKNGKPYHVVGTHAQSEADDCKKKTPAFVRARQFDEIRQFITDKNLPEDEVVFIGGDFNVIKDTPEYQDLLQRLEVLEPNSYAGHHTSWDPIGNGLAYVQYQDFEKAEYLDYIFVSARHARPSYWHNQALDIPSPRWAQGNYYYQEYSDHYPVTAFAYADERTPRQSFRAENRPYDTVHLRHEASGRFISANPAKANDWLTLSSTQSGPGTAFRLDNWYPAKHPFCIRSGDFVQLQSHVHPGYYWNWYLGFSGNYGYFLKENDSSNQLRIHMLDDRNSCLRDGDRVYFADKDTLKNRDAYLGAQAQGRWQNHLFLGSADVGANEIFQIEMPDEPVYTDWSPRLRFRE
jgi:sphingomyelin phosphodiesterase